jgi:uncharacterized protein YdcH (DUF465 family)
METEIIEALKEQNEEYRKLYEEHKKLKEALAEIDKSKYITAEEGLKRKGIQKQKLQKKDRMAEIVREYKKSRKS